MLQIHNIRKQYKTGDLVQTALDGVSLTLRDNEFVAILGPSGSGKTTLLNVIGGLDRYDSGDLVINGISTKKYTDRDWDSYRNHTIGFVFQSYNLIPHQTVLANVELALTISGISRTQRRKRAVQALESVGLGNQLHKRPNQMSGGQMQRVAIARALVNNPDILLADEPTGALDTETSLQVMELLREVSKDRLVVMVTHNPELAENYANRIVRVRDGQIIDDSNPYHVDVSAQEPPKHKNMGKASMSFLTALSLSFNNLRTKLGRTLLTSFAGSIGIIGIALIMSLSTGFQNYIDKIQEDTLSNYPLSIQSETANMTAALAAFGSAMAQAENAEEGTVLEQQMISQMFAQVGSNDLGAFKTYLESNYHQVQANINDIQYSYGVRPLIYAADTSDKILQVNPGNLFGDLTGSSAMSAYMDSNIFYEMIDNIGMLDSQYQVLQGKWPENADELIIVLSSPNQISDYMAYTLGLKDSSSLMDMISLVMQGQKVESTGEPMTWTYEDLMSMEFCMVPASAKYQYNSEYGVWEDMSSNQAYMRQTIENGQPLKIVGIVCPKEGANATTLSTGIAYTADLTRLVIEEAADSRIVAQQLANKQVDVFTGKRFDDQDDSESSLDFKDMISVDGDMLSSAIGMNVNQSAIISLFENYMAGVMDSIQIDTTPAQEDFMNTLSLLASDMLSAYVSNHADPQTGTAILRLSEAEQTVTQYLTGQTAQSEMKKLDMKYQLPAGTLEQVYSPLLIALITNYIAAEMEVPEVPEVPALPELPEQTEPAATEVPEETVSSTTQPPETTDPQTTQTPDPIEPLVTDTPESIPEETTGSQEPDQEVQTPSIDLDIDTSKLFAYISAEQIDGAVNCFAELPLVSGTAAVMSGKMMEATVQTILMNKLAGFGSVVMNYVGKSFYLDEEMLASAFQFNMNEEELRRLMDAMSGSQSERSASVNLKNLGYADLAEPTAISVYFLDFAAKENFLRFLDDYNVEMEKAGQEDQIISYTDITGIMMSSVKTIIDSVSYVLIAFVAVSLVVSSIMIGIITYISVMERTREIGVLRAIGASKRNISQVFNAETFIIGLCSGLIGIGSTLLLNIPINHIIYVLTDNPNIHAQLPVLSAAILVALSMILTLVGGLIPSKHAAKKDPVIALRSE